MHPHRVHVEAILASRKRRPQRRDDVGCCPRYMMYVADGSCVVSVRLMLPPCKVSARCGRGERGVEAGAVTGHVAVRVFRRGAEGGADDDAGWRRGQMARGGKRDVRVQERSESVSAEI
jgi:hypothetical protein